MAQYINLVPNQKLPELNISKPYKAMVIVESDCSNEWRNEVSDLLVTSGCKYMCAWGIECSLWDDSVDWSCIEFCDDSDTELVMTTWHDKETLNSALNYLKCDAEHPHLKMNQTVIFHVSKNIAEERIINEFKNA